MKMNLKDRGILASLGFHENEDGAWRVLRRGGHILLLVPDYAASVSKGLQLYRPQRLPARLFVGAVSRFPFFRLLLKRIKGSILSGGAIQTVLDTTEATLVCLLLGNPSQEERRIILLAETETGHHFIIKLGWGAFAVEKISRERKFLEMNAGRNPVIPSLTNVWREDQWEAFAIPYFDAPGGVSFEKVCDVLKSWCPDSPAVELSSLDEWMRVVSKISDEKERECLIHRSAGLKIKKSLSHRDFAPWNVLSSKNGDVSVIDWEFGREEGVPGWDLVHYLFLSAHLVDRLPSSKASIRVVDLLESKAKCVELVKYWGWAGNVNLLVKSYFYSMSEQMEDSTELAKAVHAA
jgi:hypothetical protein